MKIVVNRKDFLEAVESASLVANTRTTKPVLTCVKLIAGDDLVVMANDLEVGIRLRVNATVEKSGSTCVPAKKLLDILKLNNSDDVSISTTKDTCIIRCGNEYKLMTYDADSFPDVVAEHTAGTTIAAKELNRLIGLTFFAAEKQENTRYAVTSLLLEITNDNIRMVTTDTKRLAIADLVCTDSPLVAGTALLPIKTIGLLQKVFDDGDVNIVINKSDAVFDGSGVLIYSRVVDGKFPPYAQFMPKKTENPIPINAEHFGKAVKQAAICCDENNRVDFDFSVNNINLSAAGVSEGESQITFPIEYSGSDFKIVFDHNYLTDMCSRVKGNIDLCLTPEKDRAVFSRTGYTYLLVPMVG